MTTTTQNAIQVTPETTPNPQTLKFVFSDTQSGIQPVEFKTSSEAELSPLAAKIFGFPWTQEIYLTPQFIAITKQDWVDWDIIAEPLAGLITEHLQSGLPLWIDRPQETDNDNEIVASDTEDIQKIKNLLNKEIRPAVALDGGDVSFVRYEDQVVYIKMKGSCNGCPSSSQTLKQGIEVRFREVMPEIRSVEAV